MKKKHNDPLDLSDREIVFGEFESLVRKFAAASLEDALKSAYLYFPAMWGPNHDGASGPPPADATTLYFCMDLDDRDDNWPMWQTSIRGILYELLDEAAEDGSWADGLHQIAIELRKISEEIESRLK